MTWKKSHALARLSAVGAVLAGSALFASPALAASGGQVVSGTTLSELSLAAGPPAAFTSNFAPGDTAAASSTLLATDTNASWTLTVQDQATGDPGHMAAATVGCTASEASLQNPLQVGVTGAGTSAGTVSISGSAQTVASSTSSPLAGTTFTTSYQQVLSTSDAMATGCVYSLTATYTLQ